VIQVLVLGVLASSEAQNGVLLLEGVEVVARGLYSDGNGREEEAFTYGNTTA
jgi:hypothetical protein